MVDKFHSIKKFFHITQSGDEPSMNTEAYHEQT